MSSFIDFGLAFKNKIIELKEGDTQVALKEFAPVRLVKNNYSKIWKVCLKLPGM